MARIDREHMKRCVYKMVDSPVGRLTLVGSDAGVAAILWNNDRPERVRVQMVAEDAGHPVLVEAERQLKEYFAGQRKQFALPTIPFGETRSYREIAQQIGSPTAARAVGAANGRNPVSIVAPCHRVVGSRGELTGFAGGLQTKAQLLAMEGAPGV
jgi:methylated-DNA-[protein]-cysteine S-methyltransferase